VIVALHSRLRPGAEEGYDRDHARIPDDLARAFARAGIRDWAIWRSRLDVFHLVDCDDFEAALAQVDADPAGARWQEVIGGYVDHFVDQGRGASGPPQPLRPVHSLLRPVTPPDPV
jgi:L-rhamnose mutarotase